MSNRLEEWEISDVTTDVMHEDELTEATIIIEDVMNGG